MLARILELDRSPLFTDPIQHRVRRTWYDLAVGSGGDPTIPPMDLLDTPHSFRLSLDLPGVPREQIDIELDGRRLSIKAQRQNHDETDHKNLVRERGPVRFTRTVVLPKTVDQDAIEASVVDGVLHLTLPKLEAAAPRKITVT